MTELFSVYTNPFHNLIFKFLVKLFALKRKTWLNSRLPILQFYGSLCILFYLAHTDTDFLKQVALGIFKKKTFKKSDN